MSWWRRLLGKDSSQEATELPADLSAGEPVKAERGLDGMLDGLQVTLLLLDDDLEWPEQSSLTPEQISEEYQRLDSLLKADHQMLKELIAQPEPRDTYLNLLVQVHGQHRGQISLTGTNIDQQRQRLEEVLGVTTVPIDDASIPPADGNSLTVVVIHLGLDETRLTVWFGPKMQSLAESHVYWLTASDNIPTSGGDVLIVTSWE